MMRPETNCFKDVSENTDMLLFWGCDPETTPWGFAGAICQPDLLLVDGTGNQTDLYLP